jgi:hypothetical protein
MKSFALEFFIAARFVNLVVSASVSIRQPQVRKAYEGAAPLASGVIADGSVRFAGLIGNPPPRLALLVPLLRATNQQVGMLELEHTIRAGERSQRGLD